MSNITARLRRMGRTPVVDLVLPLGQGESLQVSQWLRILPGKRLVGQGAWRGQQVLAKLFIATGAERHWQRESNGIQALQRAGLATPALLASGGLSGGGYYLLTEFLEGSQTLQQCWEQLPDHSVGNPAALNIMRAALGTIAVMHDAGLMQADLHLGNFLRHGQQLYVIDGDAIEASEPCKPLAGKAAQSNLALFFAQFEPQWDLQLPTLMGFYQSGLAGSSPVASVTGAAFGPLLAAIRSQRHARLNNFLDKTLRDCSQFAVIRTTSRYCVVVRSDQQALAPLLADPDQFFAAEPLLKDGGSSTVTRASVNGREVVIKRYNIKGLGHWLTRFWRPSRAWHSWLAGWRLQFLGIATPQPLAMIERRLGPLRREAWLITEYCPGRNLLAHLGETGDHIPDQQTAEALLQLFGQLVEAQISHGDFKATNLLWHEDQVKLIDLDAMRAHDSKASWYKGWLRDRSRFIRNWREDSPLGKWLQSTLPQ